MLYSTFVVAAALAGFAAAQNATSDLPTGFPPCCTPPQSPNSTVAEEWCNANTNTCVDICGDTSKIAPNGNSCDPKTLDFTCKCKNGTEPDMKQYQQSVPALECREWYGQCVVAAGDGFQSAEWKRTCESNLASQCGNLTIQKSPSTSGSSSSGSGSLPSRTSTGSPSATNSGSSTSSSANAASAVAMAREFGLPVLAGGLVALFGIAL